MKQLTLLTALLAAVHGIAADPACSCYAVKSHTGTATFNHREVYDFNTGASIQGKAAAPSDFLAKLVPSNRVAPATGQNPISKSFSPDNVYMCSDPPGSGPHLRLATSRDGSGQGTAEVASARSDLLYGSFRVRARVTGARGAVASIFTYRDDSSEIDWEVLTQEGNGTFHATNQPGSMAGATSKIALAGAGPAATFGAWNDWQLDWQPGQTRMLFNGQLVNAKSVNVPAEPMSFLINMWSDGGSWSGTMAPGAAAYLDLQRLEMFYNTSADAGKACASACPVDDGAPAGGSGSDTPAAAGGATAGGDDSTDTAGPSSSTAAAATPAATAHGHPLAGGLVGGSVDACGAANSSAVCAPGLCCSAHGYCGATPDYCNAGCQPQFGTCGGAGGGGSAGVQRRHAHRAHRRARTGF